MGGELAFLERLRRALPPAPAGELWIGDDMAVLAGRTLFATDLLAEGSHFDLRWSTPADAGWKAMAVNCSDVAAMGGTPVAAVAAVLLPAGRPGLADAVAEGMMAAAGAFGCPLVGGDTAVGETLVVTVAVLGEAPPGGAVRRSGARAGDTVFVTGPMGGGRAALHALQAGGAAHPRALERLHRPTPRLAEGQVAAAAGATAMIDLSDGLASDLRHICAESGVGAVVRAASVPVGPGATLEDAIAGGDDYELCFTAADPEAVAAAFLAAGLPAPVAIGTATEEPGLFLAGLDGVKSPLPEAGWEHPVP